MKILQASLILVLQVLIAFGCTTTKQKIDVNSSIQKSQNSKYAKIEQANQSVAIALEYHDQGAFTKSAEFFIKAADLYRELDFNEKEKRSLIAAAKMHLKGGQRNQFLLTMAKYRGLLTVYDLPPEDESFLVNLSDHMRGRSPTYPVTGIQKQLFQQ